MRKIFFLVLLILALADPSGAAVKYINPAAGGGATGADWTNAYTSIPATLTRGDTYYIAEGNYGDYTFDDSGTSVITIKKCVPSDGVCTVAAGYTASHHDGQAVFYSIVFTTGYYTIDGVTGGGPGSWDSGFGIRFQSGGNQVVLINNTAPYVTLRHIDIQGDGRDPVNCKRGILGYGSNNTVSYCRIGNQGKGPADWKHANDITLEYTLLGPNGISADDVCHEMGVNIEDADNVIIRYNIFEDLAEDYQIGWSNSITGDEMNGIYIYGNVFWLSGEREGAIGGGWLLGFRRAVPVTNFKFYNNVIMNFGATYSAFAMAVSDIGCSDGGGNVIQNNLWYNNTGTISFGFFPHSYNYYNNNKNTSGGSINPSETNGQIATGNPFAGATIATRNFSLAAATNPGVTLSSTYNKDMFGVTRGQDGTWDRGAIEYTGEDVTAPRIDSKSPSGEITCPGADVPGTVTTNEPATCRISTTNQTYAAMTSAKNMTGTGTVHTTTFTSPSCPSTVTRYVACADTAGNAGATETYIFTVAAAASSEAPVMSPMTSNLGTFNCLSSQGEVGWTLYTNKDSTCKWNLTDTTYALMANTYGTPVPSNLTRSGRWLFFNGAPIWLNGYDLQWIFNYADAGDWTHDDIKANIDLMASYGVTSFRVWLNTWFQDPAEGALFPWAYNAVTGFDLDTWDADFWAGWVELVTYAKTKGIVVEVVMFSEYPYVTGGFNSWEGATIWNAWRSAENQQGAWDDVSGDLYPQFWTWDYTSGGLNLTTYQKALVDKAIAELNSIGNVFFQVSNEYPSACNDPRDGTFIDDVYPWQQAMADYMKSKGVIVSVQAHECTGMQTYGLEYWSTRDSIDILNFHPYSTTSGYANIDHIGYVFGPLYTYDKVLMFDESHRFDDATDSDLKLDTVTREMWAAFTNGIYNLAYLDSAFTMGDAYWIKGAKRLKVVNEISKLVSWSEMVKDDAMLTGGPGGSAWQAHKKAGEYYLAYFTGTPGSTAVSINLPAGSNYDYKWYDTQEWAAPIASGTVAGATPASIPAPDTGDWAAATGVVLTIIKQGISPAVGTTTHYDSDTFACGSTHYIYSRCTSGGYTNDESAVFTFNVAPNEISPYYEAEDGTLVSPMTAIVDSSASFGYYIMSGVKSYDEANTATATFTVDLSAAGATKTYRILARTRCLDNGANSFFVTIDGETQFVWDINPTLNAAYWNVWVVDSVKYRGTGTETAPQYNPYTVELTAAEHTIVFRGREQAHLDYFYLVSVPIEPTGVRIGN